MVVLTSPAVFVFWLRRSVSPTAVPLLFCFYILVRPSLCFSLLHFPLCSLLCSSFSSLVLPCSFLCRVFSPTSLILLSSLFCSLSRCFSPLYISPSLFSFSSVSFPLQCFCPLVFSSLFSPLFSFSAVSFPPPFHHLSLAFISQRMACGATSNLVTACRGIVAVKNSP